MFWLSININHIPNFILLKTTHLILAVLDFFIFASHPQVSRHRADCYCNKCLLSTRWPWQAGAKAVQAAVLQAASVSGRSVIRRWEVSVERGVWHRRFLLLPQTFQLQHKLLFFWYYYYFPASSKKSKCLSINNWLQLLIEIPLFLHFVMLQP